MSIEQININISKVHILNGFLDRKYFAENISHLSVAELVGVDHGAFGPIAHITYSKRFIFGKVKQNPS